jgi:putative ABC transport system ATP-binding protein
MGEAPIHLEGVNHYYGSGALRRQVLFELCTEVQPGEIVILTGPSGSGKTTALTLIGALRSPHEGSVRVLGEELCGASESTRVGVRRRIGYVFQQHNLLGSLSVEKNVQMALDLEPGLSHSERRARALEVLGLVGMDEHAHKYPAQLSGGQKQRVGIARALVNRPRIILADEPTASLDRRSGRDAVELIQRLCREEDVTVVLVTHDNRILDVADRILHLEDGRLVSFSDAVLSNTRHMMEMLALHNRKGDLVRQVVDLPLEEFTAMLEQVTEEAENFLRVSEMAQDGAFESMLEQLLETFSWKVGDLLGADRASLFLLDEERGELWSKVARDARGEPFEIRIPRSAGIAGAVVEQGRTENVPDAYADPRFDRSTDERTGYRTRSILCVPLKDREDRVFGVAQILNRRDGRPFDHSDEERFAAFMRSMGVILLSWARMRSERGA